MTKMQEVKTLRESCIAFLSPLFSKVWTQIFLLKPDSAVEFEAVVYAKMRLALLEVGFTYDECAKLIARLSALNQKGEFPVSEEAWHDLCTEICVGSPLGESHKSMTLFFLKNKYEYRMSRPALSAHEKIILNLAKRIKTAMEQSQDPEETIGILSQMSSVPKELIWRVATGGKRVTSVHLMSLDKALRRAESDNVEG